MTSTQKREFQVLAKLVGARCNLRCDYCYYLSRGNPGVPFIPDDLLEIYIVQHIRACTEPVIPFSWHGGEPTLFGLDGYRRIVSLQKRHCPEGRRIVNGIQTNGLLLDEDWCRFLAAEQFVVGLSLDGTAPVHDCYRVTATGESTHAQVLESYERLRRHGVATECLCVVHSGNVHHPLQVYGFFRALEVPYVTFLPLVESLPEGGVSERTVPAEAWGEFLCAIFDFWLERDIGRIKIQIFEEAARPAFGLEHTLCIFRTTCGGVPILDCNGDVYSCDHFAQPEFLLGNIRHTSLAGLLDSPRQQEFGRVKQETLPQQCRRCPVLNMCNGGCPKDRILRTPEGDSGLNYLCSGYLRFFSHCRPLVSALAHIHRSQSSPS